MANEGINYMAALADMKAKRTALDASISALEAAIASGTLGVGQVVGDAPSFGDSVSVSLGSAPVDLPVGAFLGKSIPAAIKLYLSAVKQKRTPTQIAAALKEYGIESSSDKFDDVVRAAIGKLKRNSELLRFKEGYALAEHYNESLRKKLTDGGKVSAARNGKAKARKKPAKAAKSAPAKPTTEPVAAVPRMESSGIGAQATVEGYYATHSGRELSAKDVATALDLRVQTVGLICAKLVHAGKLEKTQDGKFRMAKVQQMPKAG